MINMKNVADDLSVEKNWIEISTPVEYSNGNRKIFQKTNFWTQTSNS